jgi:nicotinate-nucleotide adenylyltransferase
LHDQERPDVRVGILGGAFDPVHLGHLLVAQDIREKLGLDRVLFMPAPRPPHKRCVAPFALRCRMLKAAIAGVRGFAISDIEARRPGHSYTVETLAELKSRFVRDELFLVIGADQFRELKTWKQPERLPGLARVIVITRPGARRVKGIVPARWLAVRQIEISSTEIRDRIARGLSVRDMLPQPVLRLIQRNQLYQPQTKPGPRRQRGNK